jgi:hypothetical protein
MVNSQYPAIDVKHLPAEAKKPFALKTVNYGQNPHIQKFSDSHINLQ